MTRSLKLQLRLKQHLYQIHKNHSLQFLNRQNIEEQVFERRQCVLSPDSIVHPWLCVFSSILQSEFLQLLLCRVTVAR